MSQACSRPIVNRCCLPEGSRSAGGADRSQLLRIACADRRDFPTAAIRLTGARFRGIELFDVDIYGEIVNLTINGVDIGPLVNAELDRRYPGRAKIRPTDPAGFREAWDVVERPWAETVGRGRRLDPGLLHESVDGEWLFTETLRHLFTKAN
jgi:hypothetical protein